MQMNILSKSRKTTWILIENKEYFIKMLLRVFC